MHNNLLLIVDDEPFNLQIAAEILRQEYDVKIATNGQDALHIMREFQPDLVLLDINMPQMSGFEVANEMKKDAKISDIPFMFLTAMHDAKNITQAFEAGACDYVSKLFIREELLLRVHNHLHLSHLQKELHAKIEELEDYKNNLEHKVEEEIQKREEKEAMLLTQSKLAAMGEMMDAAAHQWRQPISIIKMRTELMSYDMERKIDKAYIEDFQNDINEQIMHMMNTLDEFRSFFRPNKEQTDFNTQAMVNKVLLLMKDELVQNQIETNVVVHNNFLMHGVENEMKHLLINIINNAKDAFSDNGIKGKKVVEIHIDADKSSRRLDVIDNAGGIPEDIIDEIFKANFTTKREGKGTGIGLYMSKQIAMKNNGILTASNTGSGAKFSFVQKIL